MSNKTIKSDLEELIEAKKAKQNTLEKKKKEIEDKIKKTKAEIAELELLKNRKNIERLEGALKDSGMRIEDVIAAISAGKLLGLGTP